MKNPKQKLLSGIAGAAVVFMTACSVTPDIPETTPPEPQSTLPESVKDLSDKIKDSVPQKEEKKKSIFSNTTLEME